MNAIVLDYHDNIAKVRTDVGVFEGIWRAAPPTKGKQYMLELACDDIIDQDQLQHSKIAEPSISNDENGIVVNGLLEEVEDNVAFLRFFGNLFMLEISPSCDLSQHIGHNVTIRLSNIEMYVI